MASGRLFLSAIAVAAAMLSSCDGGEQAPEPASPQNEAAFLSDAEEMLPERGDDDAAPASVD